MRNAEVPRVHAAIRPGTKKDEAVLIQLRTLAQARKELWPATRGCDVAARQLEAAAFEGPLDSVHPIPIIESSNHPSALRVGYGYRLIARGECTDQRNEVRAMGGEE